MVSLLFVAFHFVLHGCSNYEGAYPQEWGAFVHEQKKDRCINISGKYLNVGEPGKTNPETAINPDR